MKVVDKISIKELEVMAETMFGYLVKADVDVKRKVVILDMGMHSDGEAYLLQEGSKQSDLWGINLHPDEFSTDDFVEFDSMINIRPTQGNASKDILDSKIRERIIQLIDEVVHE